MSVDGIYQITTSTPLGKVEITLTMKTNGDSLSGTAKSTKMGKADFSGGRVNGNSFEFEAEMKSLFGKISMVNRGVVDGDSISGEVKTSMGSVTYTGVRV